MLLSSMIACENIRFSSLFVASPAAKREEKRMFLQATSMTALAMTTIFSLQKSILSSIVNCVTHNIVLYYSYQVLENDFQIILFSFVFAYQNTNSVSSLKYFSRSANYVCYSKTHTILFDLCLRKEAINQLSTSLRNKRFHFGFGVKKDQGTGF